MTNWHRVSPRRIKFVLRSIKECGLGHTIREIFTHFGLLRSYPTRTSRYLDWQKTDMVKRIVENVVNYDEFISPNGNPIELSDEVIMRLRNGIQMYVRSNDDLYPIYETVLRQDYGFIVHPGEIVIDIGAFIGDFTILAAHAGATVYSFEPSPEFFPQMLKNIRLMKLSSRVKGFNVAITPPKYAGKKVILPHNWVANGIAVASDSLPGVECLSLKEVFVNNNIQKCDLLKIDCEGLEYEILETLESDIYAKIQRIALEFHFGCSKRVEKLRRKLESEGFFVETIIPPHPRGQGLLRCWRYGPRHL